METGIRKIALTGASGMVGMHLLQAAKSRGISCATASRSRPGFLPGFSSWQSWDLCTWLENDALDEIFGDVDALFHVGAITPRKNVSIPHRQMFDANVRSCLCLGIWALRKDIPVVYLSSSASYPEAPRITENTGLAPIEERIGGFYGYTKMLGEDLFSSLAAEGLKLCILRPSSIYGTGLSEDQMLSVFMQRAKGSQDLEIRCNPESRVNLLHAYDVASAVFKAVEKGASGIFNIACPRTYTFLEIAQRIQTVCGKGRIVLSPGCEMFPSFTRFDLDCSAAEKGFGFSAAIDLEIGLRLMNNGEFSTGEDK
ncbi:MAG: NAD-dependent epimerase/dehydratase family protein [Geobacteraceae bacterium]